MASLRSYLPEPGSAVWRRDRAPAGEQLSTEYRVRHVVIRDAEIWDNPAPHVVYKIDVLTEHDHWYLFRRYSQFHTLHKKLIKRSGVSRDLLPPKRFAGNLSKSVIDQRRQQLERYLQTLIHSESHISQSEDLLTFLDVPAHDVTKVADILTRHLYAHGDRLLEEGTPVALSVNEMYSISRRLRLPWDADGTDPSDKASDPAHLYSFIHQLKSLRVTLPPLPSSVTCTAFEITPFRSLTSLKLEGFALSQMQGLVTIQQQLTRLTIHSSVRSLRELLVEGVEERRGSVSSDSPRSSPSSTDSWRITAMAKLTDNRVVIQPWHNLKVLNLSYNQITHLDDSLQVLPSIKELILSHNLLQVLDVQFLCLPTLAKLNLSHNAIHSIRDGRKVLENVKSLNLSHNRLHSLDGVHAFVAVETLNLKYNLVASRKAVDKLAQLRWLKTLHVTGNPIVATQTSRLMLLGKLMHKSRTVTVDGQETSSREQSKLQSLRERYGVDPDSWPIASALASSTESSAEGDREDEDDEAPRVELCWQLHPPGSEIGSVIGGQQPQALEHSIVSQESVEYSVLAHTLMPHPPSALMPHPPSALTKSGNDEERYTIGGFLSDTSSVPSSHEDSLPSREEPDGQSDVNNELPEKIFLPCESGPPSHCLTPPPSTPLTSNGNYKPQVTPAMILSALEALYHIQNKDTPISLTPSEETPHPVFPEAITSALTAWITRQNYADTPLMSPPPSTPTDPYIPRAISASDLIAALSALIPCQDAGGGEESGESSAVCTVPAGTPQEGLNEWARLGIRPEEVIQALSALTYQERDREGSLSPITEEEGGGRCGEEDRGEGARRTGKEERTHTEEEAEEEEEVGRCVFEDGPREGGWGGRDQRDQSPLDHVLYSSLSGEETYPAEGAGGVA